MASPSPMSPDMVKSEEENVQEPTMEELEASAEASSAAGPELSNDMLKIMKGIVDYLTEHRDEKYVILKRSPQGECACSADR